MVNSSKSCPTRINILTINCWGLKYLAKHRNARLAEIGARIATADTAPDIVGLQECWTQEDYRSIRQQTQRILPYGKFYHSGIFGGGLAILSKWPIVESSMVGYPLNGRPTAFFRGDWFVGKGVACARIIMGPCEDDVADVFCTHLHAPYEREPYDSYICHRTAQAWEIAKLMKSAAEKGHLVIGLGDFNMVPLSLAHQIITAHAPVVDAWRALHPSSSIGAALDAVEVARNKPLPTAEFNLIENGATCDSILNTWRFEKSLKKELDKGKDVYVDPMTKDPRAKRLDYIFVSDSNMNVHSKRRGRHGAWEVSDVKVGMTERHPTLKCSLSDHFSVEAVLVRHEGQSVRGSKEALDGLGSDDSVNNGERHGSRSGHLPVSVYDDILEMIKVYTWREQRQRRLRLGHFLGEIAVAIGCFTAIWWSPRHFVSFLLVFVSTFGLAVGIIDGLIGGLFIGSEMRALKEFRWEITNARNRAQGSGHVSFDPEDVVDE